MAGEHRAGTVVVRVTADTKGFRRQVEETARGINDLDVNAVFEPDTAQLERAYREWNGKNAPYSSISNPIRRTSTRG
jgi:hypothetical protein